MQGLDQGEREFMEIFRYYKAIEGHYLMPQHVSTMGRKLMSPPNFARVGEIVKSLVKKGYITDQLILTNVGERYLYS